MTRDEYFSALKNEIMSLSLEEQAEALQYYSDYFDEANDDEKVMAELGTPEELAKTITDRFANAVVPTSSENERKQEDSNSNNKQDYGETALYFSFGNNDIRNLDLSFGAAEVVMISGEAYSIETRGVNAADFYCHLSAEGTLSVANTKKFNLNFFNHDRGVRFIPRILITVPEIAKLNRFVLKIGAGNFRSRKVSVKCSTGKIEVGAGSIDINSVNGGEIDFRCGMGKLNFTGSVTGRSDIDCGMGSLKLNIDGDISEYSYDLKLGLGNFKINEEQRNGLYQNLMNNKKSNHFSVNCGMGNVNIKIK